MRNPFVIDSPAPVSELINRTGEVSDLLQRARDGHSSRLSAPRRYGKTTLLRRLESDADAEGTAVAYVDLFGILSPGDALIRIQQAYEAALKGPVARWFAGVSRSWRLSATAGPPGVKVGVGPAEAGEELRALHEALDLPLRLMERSGTRTLVIFDEFQEVLAAADDLDGLIRSRIQHHGDAASYVFAGSHPGLMAELFGTKARPLYGQARAMTLDPLADTDLAEYIGSRFDATGRDPGRALAPLRGMARGHPQRAMLLAHHLWEATPDRATADEATWEASLDAAFAELQEEFERWWSDLTVNERRTLAAVAWIGDWGSGEGLYSKDTLNRFKLTKGTVRDVREALLRRGELERTDGDVTRLVDPLAEAWIASGRRQRR